VELCVPALDIVKEIPLHNCGHKKRRSNGSEVGKHYFLPYNMDINGRNNYFYSVIYGVYEQMFSCRWANLVITLLINKIDEILRLRFVKSIR